MFISWVRTLILLTVCRHKYNNVLWSNNHLEIRNHSQWNRWRLVGHHFEYSTSLNECDRINSRSVYYRRKRKKIFNAENSTRMHIFFVASLIKYVSIKISIRKYINIWKLLSFSVLVYLPCLFFYWDVIDSLECEHRNIPNSFDSYRNCPSYINQLA